MLIIKVKAFPKSRMNLLEKISWVENDLSLIARTTTAPENGKANQAIIKMLAKFLSVSQSSIELIQGTTCRNKVFRVSNLDHETINKLRNAFPL